MAEERSDNANRTGLGPSRVRELGDQSTQLARPADCTTASGTAGPNRSDLLTPRRKR